MNKKSLAFTEYIVDKRKQNRIEIEKQFSPQINLIEKIINYQKELIELHNWGMPEVARPPKHITLIRSIFYKNLLTFSSLLEENRQGMYGTARILMRYIFEGSMIAKYCASQKDFSLYSQWHEGKDIKLTPEVMNKVYQPDMTPFREIWKLFCGFTHASITSMQIELDASRYYKEISANFAFTLILLRFNYHILNTYILTPKARYYAKAYDKNSPIILLRKECRPLLRECNKFYSRKSGILVKNFKMKWARKTMDNKKRHTEF